MAARLRSPMGRTGSLRARRRRLSGNQATCAPWPTATRAATQIDATYSGTEAFASSSSPGISQVVNGSPASYLLSGVVTGSGGVPVSGALVHVFDAATSSYVGAATMGSAGGYTIELASGSYKAYVQTNTPGYPDQWVGGSSMADATVVVVSADTIQDLALASPASYLLSGVVTGSGGVPVTGALVHVFDAATSSYVGAATMGSAGGYTIELGVGFVQGVRADQHAGVSGPVGRRVEHGRRDRGRGQRGHHPGLGVGRARPVTCCRVW